MTVHRQILDEPIEDVAPLLDRGINVRRLDATTCEVWASDHTVLDAADRATSTDIDNFVSNNGLATAADHAASPSVLGEVSVPEDHPDVGTASYPSQATWKGAKVPTVAVENGEVVFDRG